MGTAQYTALDEAVEASSDAGVVYVVAAGNTGKDASNVTPAHAASAITVGAFDTRGRFPSFSNYGPLVDILAPGVDVVSLSRLSGPVKMSGTSMAAAHVSGAAALYLAQNPTATPAQVRDALVANALPFAIETPPNTTDLSVWVGQSPGGDNDDDDDDDG